MYSINTSASIYISAEKNLGCNLKDIFKYLLHINNNIN